MTIQEIEKEKEVFNILTGDLRVVGTYLQIPKGEALIEIFKAGKPIKKFLFPAYKIWNIPAHIEDIKTDIEHGLREAGSTGLGGNVYEGGQNDNI